MSPNSLSGINQSKRDYLRDMNVFVLDNSLRESTVAQPLGHTLKDKYKILKQIKACNFQDVIVAAFGSGRRVDDAFCEDLDKAFDGKDAPQHTYAFTEVTDSITKDGEMVFGHEHIPTGLKKMKKYGISNAIIEIDVAYDGYDWEDKFPVADVVQVVAFLCKWTLNHLPPSGKECEKRNMVNLRDLPLAMIKCPQRVIDLVAGIAKLPKTIRPAGILFEEPLGEYFPDEIANFTKTIRTAMDENGWKSQYQLPKGQRKVDGVLLYHVHEQYGLANATVLDALAAGADGIWCALSEEGASMNHASSAVALTNLARLGNKDIMEQFSTKNIVSAAREVAEVTTGQPVRAKQIVYGSGAVDICFGFGGIAQGRRTNIDYNGDGVVDDVDKFSVARLIGLEDQPARISTLASPSLVVKRLKQCFEEHESFNEENGGLMLAEIRKRLEKNIKEDYNTPEELAKLYEVTFPDKDLPPSMLDALKIKKDKQRKQSDDSK